MTEHKVIVQLVTYNHEPYIRQAIESIMMQETDFPFQLLILDDRSTDRTGEICRELADQFGDRIRLIINDKNLGPYGNAYKIIKLTAEMGVEYVAACEGDDYWTDPRKLQKQVDFLDAHPDYGICWTRYAHHIDDQIEPLDWSDPVFSKPVTEITLENIFYISRTNTLTLAWRNTAVNFPAYSAFQHPKDITIYCLALSAGRGALLNFEGANYRLHGGGMYSSVGEFNRNFQNFLSMREIIERIPVCDIEPVRIKMMWSLEQAIYIACQQEMTALAFQEVVIAHRELFRTAPITRKIKGLKELAHQSIRRARHKNKTHQ